MQVQNWMGAESDLDGPPCEALGWGGRVPLRATLSPRFDCHLEDGGRPSANGRIVHIFGLCCSAATKIWSDARSYWSHLRGWPGFGGSHMWSISGRHGRPARNTFDCAALGVRRTWAFDMVRSSL